VARRTVRPLLAVPPRAVVPASPHLLCALDLSDASATVLEYAAGLAGGLQAQLRVLTVAEATHWYDPWPISGIDAEAVRRAVVETAEQRLRGLLDRHVPRSVPCEARVSFGRPHREIERLAREDAEMVILGVGSSSGLDRLFFGSTAQHVLRAAVCPVLLVRHGA
jgi:nucleotide-binding universal stress UspA family protein